MIVTENGFFLLPLKILLLTPASLAGATRNLPRHWRGSQEPSISTFPLCQGCFFPLPIFFLKSREDGLVTSETEDQLLSQQPIAHLPAICLVNEWLVTAGKRETRGGKLIVCNPPIFTCRTHSYLTRSSNNLHSQWLVWKIVWSFLRFSLRCYLHP